MTTFHLPGIDGNQPLDEIWRRSLTQHFIHDVSHLLSGIGLALDTLDEEVHTLLAEDDRLAIQLARQNASRMHTLITETVALQRFLDRHRVLRQEPFDLEPVLREAFRPPRIGADTTVRLECPGTIPSVLGDRALTAELLAALVRTATGAHRHETTPAAPATFLLGLESQADAVTMTIQCVSPPAPGAGPAHATIDTHGLIYRLSLLAIELQGGWGQVVRGPEGDPILSFALPRAAPEAIPVRAA